MNTEQYRFIRGALRANAAFSVLSSLPLLLAPGAMANLLGVNAPVWVLPALAIGLLGFAAFVWWVSSREQASLKLINTVSAMDVLWVLGSAEILIFELISFSAAGKAMVLIIALCVGMFAAAQIWGVLRARRARIAEGAGAI